MNSERPAALDGEDYEISALIETLLRTEQHLEELTAGEVDTVADRAGRTFLLRRAQEQLRHSEAAKLRESERRFSNVLDNVDLLSLMLDGEARITYCNDYLLRLTGWARDEVIGRDWFELFMPSTRYDMKAAFSALLADMPAAAHHENTIVTRSGGERLIRWNNTVLRSAEGAAIGTASIGDDITERKDAEQHLAQMESRYRGLLEAAPDAMVVVNQADDIVLLNVQAENQFGYRRDELLGQKVTSIIPEGFAERIVSDGLRSAEDALAQQIGTGIELVGRRRDASEFPIELMLSPLASADGILVTAAIRDITARKSAEAQLLEKVEELNRSNVELEQFAAFASHDLQEPLRMVASYMKLLSKRYKGKLDSDADEYIAFAAEGAARMHQLIHDLLLYSRVGTKGKELRDTESEKSLEQAIINLRGAIQESGALVTHDPLPPVMADERQLIQLFQNLVGNAIKYQSPGTPKIHISAARNGGKKWVFSVHDNGLGIDPQYFEKIFGMFQRLHKRDEFAGTGIGLAICKKIVERHGGNISVESQPGAGSTFRFALSGSEAIS
jgi:PAS domain S-box-containing protein